jgi:hypothetical protein
MKEAEGQNTIRPHQEEFLATDGDDLEIRRTKGFVPPWLEEDGLIPPTKRGEIQQS